MQHTRLRRTFSVLALVAVTIGAQCGDKPTEPTPPPAISLNAGNGQQAAVGTAVAIAPSVKVTDASGAGVAGIAVNFAIVSGGGQIVGASQSTNGAGIAAVTSWTLGTTLGTNTVSATAAGVTGGPITFTATAVAGPARNIEVNGGNNQTVILGSAVTTPPSVRVTDAGGNPVTGTSVTFATATGGGSITGGSQTTNSSGVATIQSWTPGTIGANTLTATSTGLTGSPVTFTATATAGPAAKLAVSTAPSTTATNRVAFATQPAVRIQDANNNNVSQAGTVVTAAIMSGGGTLGGTTTATTNASGIATFTGLSISGTAGARVLNFTATGLTLASATVTTTAGAATTVAIEAGNNQTATAGSAVATPPAVKVTDADGNGVSGFGVGFAVASGGGSVTGATANSNANGIAAVGSWTLGSTPATNTLTATATGLTGSPITFTATGASPTGLKLSVTTAPTSTPQNRVAFAAQPVIQLRTSTDAAHTQAGVVVTAAITAGGGTLNGTATATTNANGVATFTDLSIAGTAGARTLTFSATGFASITATVTTTAGAAATIAVNANNNQSATAGTALATTPSVKVADADANGVQGVSVTFAVATGGGSATGLSQTTNASGVAAPTTWTLGATPGSNTMTATAAGLAGSPVTLTATGTASSVSLTSVAPALLTPGIAATITGTGFNTTPASNAVTVDGVAATVTAATSTSLTFTVPAAMPCEATHDATISVTVTGEPAKTITKALQVAVARTLSVGQSVVVTSASEQRCNELSNTGTSRYYVSVSNTSTTYTTGIAGTPFQLRGAAGSGASGGDPVAGRISARGPLSSPPARRRPVLTTNTPADAADRAHMRLLDQNIRFLNENRGRFGGRPAGATRSIAVPVVGDVVNLNIPNINNSSICTSPFAMTGRIVYVGSRSIIVEDNANPMAGTIDTTYQSIGTEFDNTMYSILETYFGNPLAKDATTDNNGRIVMVFSKKVNDNMPGIAGFVVSCDFSARNATTNTTSNFGEYFYATAPTTSGTMATSGTTSPPKWRWTMRGTIIHEVKHIVSFAERIARNASTFEASWLEETTARMSEELYERAVYSFTQRSNILYGNATNTGPYCGVRNDPSWTACVGRPRGIVRVFEELAPKWYTQPETYSPLGRIDANDFSFYATGWSFLRWAIDQSTTAEATFIKALVQETSLNGVANLEARTGRTFAEMLPEWTMANVLDDYPGWTPAASTPASGRMTQLSWNFRDVFSRYKADFTTQVPWAAWPLNPHARSFGTFTVDAAVKPGTSAIIELSGTAGAKQLLELKAQTGTAAAPSELRITIVRVQ